MIEPMSKELHTQHIQRIRDEIQNKTGLELHYCPDSQVWCLATPEDHELVAVVPITADGVLNDLDRLRGVWMWLVTNATREA